MKRFFLFLLFPLSCLGQPGGLTAPTLSPSSSSGTNGGSGGTNITAAGVGLSAVTNGATTTLALSNFTGNTLFVSKSGNDSTGARGSLNTYLTIGAAVAAAQAGDVVHVYPGVYAENNLLKVGVNYFGEPGADIVYLQVTTNDAGFGIFDDRPIGPTTNVITWNGLLQFTGLTNVDLNTTALTIGNIVQTNFTSFITLNGNRILITGGGAGQELAALSFYGGKWAVMANEISDPFFQQKINTSNHITHGAKTANSKTDAIVWQYGTGSVAVRNLIQVNNYGMWGNEVAFATQGQTNSEMYFNFEKMLSTIYIDCGSTNYKSWIIGKDLELPTNSTAIQNGSALKYFGGGKHYVSLQKLGDVDNTQPIVAGTSALALVSDSAMPASNQMVWADIQKISASNCWVSVFSGNLWLNVKQFEDLGTVSNGIYTTSNATVSIDFQNMKVLNGPAVNHGGIRTDLYNGIIDTSTGAATNDYPVFLSASNCYLHNLVLLSPASTQPIYASTVQTNGIYGQVMANNNTNHLIQFSPLGTWTVDANSH